MKPTLRIPAVLAVAVLTAAGTAALVTSASCGDDTSPTCEVLCVPAGSGTGAACQGPDYPCATGSNLDQCPAGCVPEPLV